MATIQEFLLGIGLPIQLFLVIAGLRKGNLRICYSFFFFLVVGLVSSVSVTYLIESREGKRLFYIAKELGLDCIKVVLLLELNLRIFRYYPRVKRSNFSFFVLAGIFLLFYIWLVPPEKLDWWGTVPLDLHSKIQQTTCIIFFAFAGAILFYRLNLDPRHKFLLLGFLFSQFPQALAYTVVASFGERARPAASLANSICFVLALLIWTGVYFRRDQTTASIPAASVGLDLPHDSRATQ
jgi:hypothetical protein